MKTKTSPDPTSNGCDVETSSFSPSTLTTTNTTTRWDPAMPRLIICFLSLFFAAIYFPMEEPRARYRYDRWFRNRFIRILNRYWIYISPPKKMVYIPPCTVLVVSVSASFDVKCQNMKWSCMRVSERERLLFDFPAEIFFSFSLDCRHSVRVWFVPEAEALRADSTTPRRAHIHRIGPNSSAVWTHFPFRNMKKTQFYLRGWPWNFR